MCSAKVAARLQHSCALLVSSCFTPHQNSDPALAELAAAAAAKFRNKFCAALSCGGSSGDGGGDAGGFWERSRCARDATRHGRGLT